MFTGIVMKQGNVRKVGRKDGLVRIEIEAPEIARSLHQGDSVSVNGVCLSAIDVSRRRFSAEIVPETLAKSTLGDLMKGEAVNLELAARLSDRVGGHLVQGHVDGVARVVRIEDQDEARRMWWSTDDGLLRYMVPKGSVALDGVSLTIVEVGRTSFQVALIPHTLDNTSLGRATVGAKANVEVDVIAKYVERLAVTGHEWEKGHELRNHQ
jgi:riboflavin synthase